MTRLGHTIIRWTGNRRYFLSLMAAFALPLITLSVVQAMLTLQNMITADYFEAFRVGENYNIGVLSVGSWEQLNNLSLADFLKNVLSGTVIQCVVVFAVITNICSDSDSGFITYAIVKGNTRTGLYFTYLLSSVIVALPIMLVASISTLVLCSMRGYGTIESPSSVVVVMIAQVAMMLCLLLSCVAIVLVFQSGKVILLVAAVLCATPMITHYIYVFSGGSIRIERALVICNLIESGSLTYEQLQQSIGIGFLTAIVFVTVGLFVFNNKDY